MHDKLVELRNLEKSLVAADAKGVQGQSVEEMEAICQRIVKVDQNYGELSDRRERVFENSRRWPIDHGLMYAGASLAHFKQNCEELIPMVVAGMD